jgi:hypothetical protein
MRRISYPTARRRIGDKGAAPKTPSRLACRTAIVAGIALASAFVSANAAQAKARPCSLFIDEQECCSMHECSGHVLGHKTSAKECKRTFHGASWHPASGGQGEAECTNF